MHSLLNVTIRCCSDEDPAEELECRRLKLLPILEDQVRALF